MRVLAAQASGLLLLVRRDHFSVTFAAMNSPLNQDGTASDDDSAGSQTPAITEAVSRLMDRHNVANRQKLNTLVDVLSIAYAQIRRRWIGQTPWAIEELVQIAEYFDEPLGELLCSYQDGPGEPAVFMFEDMPIIGTLWRGRQLEGEARIGPLVATPTGPNDPPHTHWKVVPLAQVGDAPVYEIRRMLFEPASRPRVAILDDDAELAETIATYFRGKGLPASAFSDVRVFQEADATRAFAGYIIDWVIGDCTAEDLVRDLRQRDKTCPILVLTGKAGSEYDAVQSRTAQSSEVYILDKPTRCSSLYSMMSLMIARREEHRRTLSIAAPPVGSHRPQPPNG